MARNSSNDISVHTLEQLVKTHGDNIVVAYIRYKKLKACKGYKEACNRAGLLSRVKCGRRLEGGKYAVVIRVRMMVFLIIPAILILISGIRKMSTHAGNREYETETSVEVIEPIETDEICQDDKAKMQYMDIPGYTDIVLSSECRTVILYNPENNPCKLGFTIRIGENTVYESDKLEPGRMTEADFYERLIRGIYDMQIVTTGYTESGVPLNSVWQNINLTVK